MSGPINTPGTLTVELAGQDPRTLRVQSGPWQYATFLCWVVEGAEQTTYAPLENVVTWTKENDA